MAHIHRLAALASSPYMKLLNKSYRCNSDYYGMDYPNPNYPPSPPCESDSDYDDPSMKIMYQSRKYSHGLPSGQSICLPFDPLPDLPCDIFRNTQGEVLGPGAGKCRVYKNPEYFSFHHNTFYDLHMLLRMYRKASMVSGRKPSMNTYQVI